ncbi:hypothetical protein JCM8097_003023 [Rhodosporidiobolus ruineniae]
MDRRRSSRGDGPGFLLLNHPRACHADEPVAEDAGEGEYDEQSRGGGEWWQRERERGRERDEDDEEGEGVECGGAVEREWDEYAGDERECERGSSTSSSSSSSPPSSSPSSPFSTSSPSPSPSPPSPSPTDPSASLAEASASASPTASAFVMPGRSLAVLPIGLGVFGGVAGVALIVVALVTYERRRYRHQFRTRRLAQDRQRAMEAAQREREGVEAAQALGGGMGGVGYAPGGGGGGYGTAALGRGESVMRDARV